MFKKDFFAKSLAISLFFAPLIAGAQATCRLNGQVVPCGDLGKAVGGFLGFGLGFMLLIFAFSIWSLVFWIMMVVHAASHPVENKPMWIILMVFTGIVGAIIYYFVVKRKFAAQPVQASGTTTSSQPGI